MSLRNITNTSFLPCIFLNNLFPSLPHSEASQSSLPFSDGLLFNSFPNTSFYLEPTIYGDGGIFDPYAKVRQRETQRGRETEKHNRRCGKNWIVSNVHLASFTSSWVCVKIFICMCALVSHSFELKNISIPF